MKPKEYLDKVAYKAIIKMGDTSSQVYKSKFDDSYITHIGMEDSIAHLAKREITEQLTHGVGYSPKNKKWYGWSHRAIYGFKIGSTCKKGDCHYRAKNLKDELTAAINFWSEPEHINVRAEKIKDGLIEVSWEYTDAIRNKKLRGTTQHINWYYEHKNPGRGEWVAKTMEDAKQMAIDFNEGVS